MRVEEIDLIQTSIACPEQYVAIARGKNVGYLRLRWGQFKVECPFRGKTVYTSSIGGGLTGEFPSEDRERELAIAKEKIAEYWTPREGDLSKCETIKDTIEELLK